MCLLQHEAEISHLKWLTSDHSWTVCGMSRTLFLLLEVSSDMWDSAELFRAVQCHCTNGGF